MKKNSTLIPTNSSASKKSTIPPVHFTSKIADSVPAMIAVYNIHTGEYLYVNRSIKRLLGYSPRDFMNQGLSFVTSLVHPDDLQTIMVQNAKALKKANSKRFAKEMDDSITTFEYRMKHKNGKWVWLQTEGSIFSRDSHGNVEAVLNVSIDISERKETEEKLKDLSNKLEGEVKKRTEELSASEKRFRSLIEHNSDVIALIDKKGNILFTSPSTERILGYSVQELIGNNSFSLIHPQDEKRIMKVFSELVSIHSGVKEEEFRIKHKNGSWVWIDCVGSNFLHDPDLNAIVINYRVITERKKREDQQRILQDITKKLVTSLNHQITIHEIAGLIVPALADYCRIAIVGDDGEIKEIVANHENPKKISLTKELYNNYIDDPEATHGIKKILQTGTAEIISSVDESILTAFKHKEALMSAIKTIGLKSYMGVPLTARGKVIGAMTFSSIQDGRYYTNEDLEFVQEIARRIALTLDNGKLYREAINEIEQRKIAEQKIRESEERYRLVVENSTDIISLVDVKGNILYASPSFKHILGYPSEELIGKNAFSLFHPDDMKVTQQAMKKAITGEHAFAVFRAKHKSGHWVILEGSGSAIIDETGRPSMIVTAAHDITAQKEFEKKLVHRGNQLEILSQVSRDINRVLNTKAIMRTLVKAAIQITTASEGTYGLMDKRKMLFTEYFKHGTIRSINVELEKGTGIPGRILKQRKYYISNDIQNDPNVSARLEKFPKFYNLIYIPIFDRNGEMSGCIELHNKEDGFNKDDVAILQGFASSAAIAHENAELFRLQKELEKRKDDFISMASHELKTPLTSLKAYTQILRSRVKSADNSEASYFVRKMDDQISKLTKLVAELLDISRIQTGKLRFTFEEFDLKELIEDIVEAMQGVTIKHTFTIQGDVKKNVVGDRYRIYQVITNLLNNAIKYSPKESTIIISLKSNENEVIVSIQDFGIGITKKNQERIFERLYQVNEPTEKTYPGLGIGLYISSQIIKRHGGDIWVESEKGRGSTFFFCLPLNRKKNELQRMYE